MKQVIFVDFSASHFILWRCDRTEHANKKKYKQKRNGWMFNVLQWNEKKRTQLCWLYVKCFILILLWNLFFLLHLFIQISPYVCWHKKRSTMPVVNKGCSIGFHAFKNRQNKMQTQSKKKLKIKIQNEKENKQHQKHNRMEMNMQLNLFQTKSNYTPFPFEDRIWIWIWKTNQKWKRWIKVTQARDSDRVSEMNLRMLMI